MKAKMITIKELKKDYEVIHDSLSEIVDQRLIQFTGIGMYSLTSWQSKDNFYRKGFQATYSRIKVEEKKK